MNLMNQHRLLEALESLFNALRDLYVAQSVQVDAAHEQDLIRAASDRVGKAHAKLIAVERSLAGVPEPEKTR